MLPVRHPNARVSIALPERRKPLAALKEGDKQSLKRVLAPRSGNERFASNAPSHGAMWIVGEMPKEPPNVSAAVRPHSQSSAAMPNVSKMQSGLAPLSATCNTRRKAGRGTPAARGTATARAAGNGSPEGR